MNADQLNARMREPMFPKPHHEYPNGGVEYGATGETLQVYAAIHLKVPRSGIPALDAMIRESRRMDIILAALTGDRGNAATSAPDGTFALLALTQAEALMCELEKEEAGGAE